MLNLRTAKWAVALCLTCLLPVVTALEITQEAWEKIQKRLDERDAQLAATRIEGSTVDVALDNKYGPNANVTTKSGKLQIGGLLQVWFYSMQRDNRGFFDDPNVNGIVDDNSTSNNSSFRIRRSEIRLYMDINENFSSYLMIDPAREALGFPAFPSNQGTIKRANNVSAQYLSIVKPVGVNSTSATNAAQNGAVSTTDARLLQDAYINWHGCIPHHDFQIGQWCRRIGEEAVRDNGKLDFVERSMAGSLNTDMRDMGAQIHGSWWECSEADTKARDGRFQYWLGVWDGAASFFDAGNGQNRPDNNNQKDLNVRFLIRPLWDDCMGHLEIGASADGGRHGLGHNDLPLTAPYVGLDRPINWAIRYNAWGSYRFGDFLSGLWLRTEWSFIKDRENPGTVIDPLGNGTGANKFAQQLGQPFSRTGYYGTIAYNFGESICNLPCWMKPVEILSRYDQFQNIDVASLVTPYKTDRFFTRVWTAGVNYYVSSHNCKVQANYNWVDLPAEKSTIGVREFHNTRNDSFVINFQVAF